MSSTAQLLALAGLIFLFLLSLRWVFGAPKPKRARAGRGPRQPPRRRHLGPRGRAPERPALSAAAVRTRGAS